MFLTCEDVLNCVGDDKVLVRDETHDWLLIFLGHGWLLFSISVKLCSYMKRPLIISLKTRKYSRILRIKYFFNF